MASHSENSPQFAVSQTKGSWHFFPVKRIAVLLAITVSILAVWYADESEDTFVAHSIMSEVYMPDKFGYGMVAKRNISRGTLIIREKPILVLPMHMRENPTAEWVAEKLSKLSFRKRRAYKALSASAYPHLDPDVARWRTNAYWTGGASGICLKSSRFNHGCSSAKNVAYNWRPETEELETYAIKNITIGEEILNDYIDTAKMIRQERQEYLLRRYNFECKCSVCSLPENESRESDKRIIAINELNGQLGKTKNGLEETRLINRLLQLTEEEGVPSSRGQLAWMATKSAAVHGDEDAAREWGALAKKWATIELGPTDRTTRMVSKVAVNPREFGGWNQGSRMTVERPILKA